MRATSHPGPGGGLFPQSKRIPDPNRYDGRREQSRVPPDWSVSMVGNLPDSNTRLASG